MMGAETITLGCRLNFAESETMRALAGDDTIIVNSCAVTNEAVRQTRQAIRRAHRERPDKRIFVTGCAVQLNADTFAAMPEVDRVIGNADKYLAASFHRDAPSLVSDVMTAPAPTVAAGFLQRVRSFVAIQTGCDHRCTFCSIWQARGPSRSLPYEAVRSAVQRELDAGAREIVLTGVDITSYEPSLGLLCQQLLRDLPALRRLRLSSLDSIEIDDVLLELVAGEQRMLPHFHLSLQAGDDLILKRMKRRHSRAQAVATIERLRAARSDVTIGADLIAGFPTESEDAAANTRALIDDCAIVTAHVFPFSPRPNTPAARMPQLDRGLIKARAAQLREAAARRRSDWLDSLIGTRQTVLIENGAKGHSDGFAPVRIEGSRRGELGMAKIIGRTEDLLIGEFE
ncbi:MiaB/RimO family radical SAM methylthiotransferase [Sphingomonas sp. LY160]|uniref:MiaB/RimO family radical SAM methylthiotransferase n=1 Tax=Sphingomonas sp. LY160 TaxID=3095342 RepID=UPI002ADEDAA7|nr:MiaB/RimO family radical SAM methylthiotransferase [Sphingomonas sp. LY160]MEA1071265.1 MiaB/RimO family radical SAM methylthiotransferase [Sphingomonas sp. LY160]